MVIPDLMTDAQSSSFPLLRPGNGLIGGDEGSSSLSFRRRAMSLKFLAALAAVFKLKASSSLKMKRTNGVLALLKRVLSRIAAKKKTIALIIAAVYLARRWWRSGDGDASENKVRGKKIAVVGSGIAGSAAAWALARAGAIVKVYEKKPHLGGNAKTYEWDVSKEMESSPTWIKENKLPTGLSVLAWPDEFFHNYNALIEELDVPTVRHRLLYLVAERAGATVKTVFAHGGKRTGATPADEWRDPATGRHFEPEGWLADDLSAWGKLVSFVTKVNAWLQPSEVPSLYRMNVLNPLNMVSLHTLCRWFGVSEKFWRTVFVPIHTSTFLEMQMDDVPAVMAEVLDTIVPFRSVPEMRTWSRSPDDVFRAIRKDVERTGGEMKTSCAVEKVEFFARPGISGSTDVVVHDEDGNVETFDKVIMACSAKAMNRILHGEGDALPGTEVLQNDHNGLDEPGAWPWKRALGVLEKNCFSRVVYTTDRDPTFERGVVHRDAAAVFPADLEDELLSNRCNYIEIDADTGENLENTFILSSWAPTVQPLRKTPQSRPPVNMLVTYNAKKKLENVDSEWVVTSREGHPSLTLFQMIASNLLFPLFQGTRNKSAWFCGSGVAAANGHDLSLLSGFVVAHECGAPYPFPDNEAAMQDFRRLQKMMLY